MSDENKGQKPNDTVSDGAQVESDEVRDLKSQLKKADFRSYILVLVVLILVVKDIIGYLCF